MTIDVQIKWLRKKKQSPSLKAKTYSDLHKLIAKKKADGNPIGEFEWDEFRYDAFADKATGRIAKVVVRAGWVMTVPKWAGAGKAEPKQKAAWDKAIAALARHEETHRLFHLEALARFSAQLEAMEDPAPEDIEAAFRQMIADHDAEQTAYDGRTTHGVKEGAFLPAPDAL